MMLPLLLSLACLQESRDWSAYSKLSDVTNPNIMESSGLAPSLIRGGQYYTHNDSGDSARFFEIDLKGTLVRTYKVTGAEAVDWEDMASARIGGKPYLFFGDIGDNGERRESIVVYRVPEPKSEASNLEFDVKLTLHYPDKPHNAETLMVHPRTGDIYIVTKTSAGPSLIFVLPRPSRSGDYMLKKAGAVSISSIIKQGRLVTGGVISPDGKHVALKTYLGLFEFDAPAEFDKWVLKQPRSIEGGFNGQTESITYSPDGMSLIGTAEGRPCPIFRSTLPRKNN